MFLGKLCHSSRRPYRLYSSDLLSRLLCWVVTLQWVTWINWHKWHLCVQCLFFFFSWHKAIRHPKPYLLYVSSWNYASMRNYAKVLFTPVYPMRLVLNVHVHESLRRLPVGQSLCCTHPSPSSTVPVGQKHPTTHWRVQGINSPTLSHVLGQAVPQVLKTLSFVQFWPDSWCKCSN